jgi:hypothetical protein
MADDTQKRPTFLKVEHHWGDQAVTRFANEISIQQGQGVYYLSFYEVVPPVIIGSPEEIAERIEKMKSIRAEGIVRVVVPAEKMAEFANILQITLGRAVDEKTSGPSFTEGHS